MKARDWLADQNLAKRGAKGKFSTVAMQALAKHIAAGNTFDDWDKNGRIKPVTNGDEIVRTVKMPVQRVTPIIKTDRVAIRGANKMRVVDTNGAVIILDTHTGKDSCNKPIRFCSCKNLRPPHYIDVESFTFEV